jgi:hypothetical protein
MVGTDSSFVGSASVYLWSSPRASTVEGGVWGRLAAIGNSKREIR